MKIEIREVMNGYVVEIQKTDSKKQYIYSNTEPLKMLEFIGRELLNPKRVHVVER